MGFALEYLSNGTVKGVLDLSEEVFEDRCLRLKKIIEIPEAEVKQKPAVSEKVKEAKKEVEATPL